MEAEIILTYSKSKLTFKRTAHGVVCVELAKPGFDGAGAHGWLVADSLFLEPADVEGLLTVLLHGTKTDS